MDVTGDDQLAAMWSDACHEAAKDVWYEALEDAEDMIFRDACEGGADKLLSAFKTVKLLRIMERSEKSTVVSLDALRDFRREGIELSGSLLKALARKCAEKLMRTTAEKGLSLDQSLSVIASSAAGASDEARRPTAASLIDQATAAGSARDRRAGTQGAGGHRHRV